METYICSPARNWESVRLPFSRSKSLGEQRAGWHSSECFKVPAIEPEGAQGVWRRDFVRKMYRKIGHGYKRYNWLFLWDYNDII